VALVTACAALIAAAPVAAPAMLGIVEVKVPDIGDFKEVEVIELLVKVGDVVKVDQSLITVESDKASMEIPCNMAGVVKELKVKIGDKVAEGSVVLMLEAQASTVSAAPPSAPAATATSTASQTTTQAAPQNSVQAAAQTAAAPQALLFEGHADYNDGADEYEREYGKKDGDMQRQRAICR
jgi:pyruvate dehydrogenase E2 component (dihydrolipoamide acetyltransferase)